MAAETYRDRPACEACGAAIDPRAGDFDEEGRRVCAACSDRSALDAQRARMRSATNGAASMALGLALTSWVCGGLFLAGVALVIAVGALGAARTAAQTGDARAVRPVWVLATLALLVAAARVLVTFAVFVP